MAGHTERYFGIRYRLKGVERKEKPLRKMVAQGFSKED
jgi:hypothetical protein